MEATARVRFLRVAPRKVRYLADIIRGKPVGEALDLLAFTPRAAAKPLSKLLQSAVSNAEQKGISDVDQMVVSDIQVDGGPVLRRWLPRAMGRATRIDKRTSHVRLKLGEG